MRTLRTVWAGPIAPAVLVTVAALLLAGCSGSGPSGPSGTGTSAGPASTGAASTGHADSGAGSGSDADSGEAAGRGSGAASGSGTRSTGGSSGATGALPTDGATVTVGGALDAQSTAWFSAFCTGMAPVADVTATMGTTDDSDPTALQRVYAQFLTAVGDAMINTANTLRPLPPPTFDQGSQIAGTLIEGMSRAGPALKDGASRLAVADVTSDQELDQAINDATSTLSDQLASVSLSRYQLDDSTRAALRRLPDCAPLFALSGDSADATG